jgi:hypothetical protein
MKNMKKSKKDKNLSYSGICGQTKDLLYDKKISRLNIQLGEDQIGAPILVFEDWTQKDKAKELFRMHIKEAMELKSIIDQLIFDYTDYQNEEIMTENGRGS